MDADLRTGLWRSWAARSLPRGGRALRPLNPRFLNPFLLYTERGAYASAFHAPQNHTAGIDPQTSQGCGQYEGPRHWGGHAGDPESTLPIGNT